MLLDHAGMILFPDLVWLRAVGRLSMPVFAYFIAEGMKYTGSAGRYFLRIFLTGVVCQIPYTVVTGDFHLNILLTFSGSVITIEAVKRIRDAKREYCYTAVLFAVIAGVLVLCCFADLDYGIFGVLLPVCAFLPERKSDKLILFTVCLAALCASYAADGKVIQLYSLLSVFLLMLYNGRRGRYNIKYFFYIFYPAHILILYAVSYLI